MCTSMAGYDYTYDALTLPWHTVIRSRKLVASMATPPFVSPAIFMTSLATAGSSCLV